MNTNKYIFSSLLAGCLGTACAHNAVSHQLFPDQVNKDYLRDMAKYPIEMGESGEETNVAPGVCNNFNFRFKKTDQGRAYGEAQPIFIMQHHTVGNFPSTRAIFLSKMPPLSAHYVNDKDGTVYYFVDGKYRAYHGGIGSLSENSKLNPDLPYDVLKNDINSWSIGIENVNSGNEPYTPQQILANAAICQGIVDTYPTVNAKLMVGHSDWSPGRKIDPNPYFPWDKLANAQDEPCFNELDIHTNFGIFPRKRDLVIHPNPAIVVGYKEKGAKLSEEEQAYVAKLHEYGYDIPEEELAVYGPTIKNAILSFKLHHAGQDILDDPALCAAWDAIYDDHKKIQDGNLLYQLNQNDVIYLDDLLDQFAK
ncbi:MAG: N-acetylmuramoyl-L-alanine amidase [Amoebophilaceae bacterium]|nr:N-acetylmuramoyl-L-alanine amidase [Amoebophilaceae bacterium]